MSTQRPATNIVAVYTGGKLLPCASDHGLREYDFFKDEYSYQSGTPGDKVPGWDAPSRMIQVR
jgi:hypothetical protein